MFLLVPAYPGSPGQRPLNGCVCVCVCVCVVSRLSSVVNLLLGDYGSAHFML